MTVHLRPDGTEIRHRAAEPCPLDSAFCWSVRREAIRGEIEETVRIRRARRLAELGGSPEGGQ